ncbi:prepilin peptidase [Agrococcus beijingensis]|uniref:prepilin peptidase n=1 Tax=Agrococcus beijingensis TaxID=3068634 RepID=UPI00274197FD|nr:prepilin peptidase [Agrococcus sp. REN33]
MESESRWLQRWIPTLLGVLGGAAAAAFPDHWGFSLALCALAIGSALLIPVDLAEFRLPDLIVWPMTTAVLGVLLVTTAVTGEWPRFSTALLAMLAVGGGYFVLAWISPTSMGLGDVKLSLVLGLTLGWFGWQTVAYGIVAGFIVFALLALVMLALRRTSAKSDLAFGPSMIVGAAIGLAWVALTR